MIKIKTIIITLVISIFSSMNVFGQWEQVSSPPNNFFTDHTYGFSLNEKGYLLTGTDMLGNLRADFYQYDPIVDEFTQLPDFPGGARGFSIGDTWDGKAYFGFGETAGSIMDDLWSFDPNTMEWTELESCPCRARLHPALIAHNGKVFVGLGNGPGGNYRDWWIYDIATNSWSQGRDFPSSERHHPYQFGIGDYIYAGFGHGESIYNEWYRYDELTNTWDEMATLPDQGRVAGAQFSHNGMGYALSGEGETHSTMAEGEFWRYDPEINIWDKMESHPGNSRWAPASFVINDEVYLFNGVVYDFNVPTVYVREAYKFDLSDDMVSTNETQEPISFNVAPNPFENTITIVDGENLPLNAKGVIYNVQGEVVAQIENLNKAIDLSNLTSGSYWLDIKNTGTRKLLIKL